MNIFNNIKQYLGDYASVVGTVRSVAWLLCADEASDS